MTDKVQTSFTIGKETKRIVAEVVARTDRYSGAKDFYETAVRNNARAIQSLATESQDATILITLLDGIRGITEEDPVDQSRATISLDNAMAHTRPRIELTPEQMQTLDQIVREVDLKRSEIIRRCIFRQLYRIHQKSDLLPGWRGDEIESTWEEVKTGLMRPKLNTHSILHRRFVDESEIDNTVSKIRADPPSFDRFADEYVRRFYQSDAYEYLRKHRGERAFNNIENIIEEHSTYTVGQSPDEKSFLEELLEAKNGE